MSDSPAAVEAYDMSQAVGDIVCLMEALDETSAIVVGHDLGAWVAQACAMLRPELVAPAVAWLASERCSVSGQMIAAGGGHFSVLEFFKTRGVQFDPRAAVSADMIDDAFADKFDFDVLDPTKIIPEELVPIKVVGRLVLDRMVDNFFAETEQVAFCTQNVPPGIDFTNDPLL